MEGVPEKFTSPEEEIAFLRSQIANKERELLSREPEADSSSLEVAGREGIREYVSFTPQAVLHSEYELSDLEVAQSAKLTEVATDPVQEILQLASEKGIKNALIVLEKTGNAYIIDEVHRRLIEEIKSGVVPADLKEGVPPWHVLHMTLYEVTLPAQKSVDGTAMQFTQLVTTMQQLLAGLRTIGAKKDANYFVIEIAVADKSDDTVFYVSVPNEYKSLFEKQTLSLFPSAVLIEQAHDYNISVDGGHTLVSEAKLKKHSLYPLNQHEDFSADPLAVILNAFSQIEREGGGAAVQFVIHKQAGDLRSKYGEIIKLVEKGEKPAEAISRSTMSGMLMNSVGEMFGSMKDKKPEDQEPKEIDQDALNLFNQKMKTELYSVNLRLTVSALELPRAEQIMTELKSGFNQFDSVTGNQIAFQDYKGMPLRRAQKAFSFRQFDKKSALTLATDELATMIHFPGEGVEASSQFKQSYAKTAAAPTEMPSDGTLLGINKHRGLEKEIYITEKDRMRHFYVIGQTGTGKSVFVQNLIVQDIQAGAGVCMIDPHGNDIQDVLGAIPPEREQDVIYFDPSQLDSSIGLNMLEFDQTKPEQKTFIVNELLSIFQKLYGANPESMGPMFEQYFRNATMLVMEDPDSGNTLMDIGRVMADAKYRREKLAKATNPVVVQFWTEIAGKAGGEASLENIVPYIVSKIDPLTANDYIRPIIGQQHSSFNFRELIDNRKILLVNLSKGRLGEINSNLIGMIVVGKILMAALSRVDDPSMSFPSFFLHIDEFQNISTPAIASILSEARKYKLGLTVAHQFTAQLDPVIKDAVFGNVGSMVAFRVGNDDSQILEAQFAPSFTAADIMNTPNYNAVMRVLANGTPTQAFSASTMPPPESDKSKVARLIAESYAKYGRPREEIEADIQQRYQKPVPAVPPRM